MAALTVSYNIASLPVEEQERVQLSRRAAWLIRMRQCGKVTTMQINLAINDCSEKHREWFRDELNRFREIANAVRKRDETD